MLPRLPEAPARDAGSVGPATPASAGGVTDPGDSLGDIIAWACMHRRLDAAMESAPTFAVGELVAKRYSIEQLVARGGMGEVYVAFDRLLEERLALKAVVSTLADDRTAIRRLCREVRLARRVRHPNVCHVHDIGIHGDDPRDVVYFMTMNLITGQSLRRMARTQPVSLACAVDIGLQILSGLQAVHRARILHRDLKSDNVMVSGTGAAVEAVIVDFGLARTLDDRQHVAGAPMSGSIGYMAPEQLDGRDLSPPTDIFAFGVVLFELLTGRLPFERRGSDATVARVEPLANVLSALRPDVPAALAALLERCLRQSPAERYPDARSAAVALASARDAADHRPVA